MKRILHVFEHLNNAGTETVMLNWYTNLNKDILQFDFLVFDEGTIENKFLELGANIYKIKTNQKKKFYREMILLLQKNHYDTVHIHMCDMMYVSVLAAKKMKVSNIIIHSHTGMKKCKKISAVKKWLLDFFVFSNCKCFFACSKMAAEYLFPFNKRKAKVIFNGIDVEKFKFDKEIRDKKRKEFGFNIKQNIIINVGRLEEQKYQEKIIEIAKIDDNKDNIYIIVGTGKKQDKLIKLIDEYKLNNKVFMLGERNDVNELLCMSDVFLFTSKFEGLGIVLIEAQISGMKVLTSDSIPEEANLNLGNYWEINLSEDNVVWYSTIQKILKKEFNRDDIFEKVIEGNYNIKKVAKKMEEFYLNLV